MALNKIIKSLVAPIVALVLEYIINKYPDLQAEDNGSWCGRWVTDNCREIMGDSWEKIEDALQKKIGHFTTGMFGINGTDYDDNT